MGTAHSNFSKHDKLTIAACKETYVFTYMYACKKLAKMEIADEELDKAGTVGIIDKLFISLDDDEKFVCTEVYEGVDACQICLMDWDDDVVVVALANCTHSIICKDCYGSYLKNKIKEEDVTPWIACPAVGCKTSLAARDLAQGVSDEELYKFIVLHMRRHLNRHPGWIECKSDKCNFGFLVEDGKERVEKCSVCSKKQKIGGAATIDDGFKELLDGGQLRPCPKCEHLTMKDYGMCNVMQCAKCGIWWNWRTRATGKSSKELKSKSRKNGSLWEPGELEYQRSLEQNEPEKFKELLEKNGVQYKKNYVRGKG